MAHPGYSSPARPTCLGTCGPASILELLTPASGPTLITSLFRCSRMAVSDIFQSSLPSQPTAQPFAFPGIHNLITVHVWLLVGLNPGPGLSVRPDDALCC